MRIAPHHQWLLNELTEVLRDVDPMDVPLVENGIYDQVVPYFARIIMSRQVSDEEAASVFRDDFGVEIPEDILEDLLDCLSTVRVKYVSKEFLWELGIEE